MRHLVCNNDNVSMPESIAEERNTTIAHECNKNTHESSNFPIRLEEEIRRKQRFCSFEIFAKAGMKHELYERLFTELGTCSPLFYSITWHAQIPVNDHPSLNLSDRMTETTLLHLTAIGLTREDIKHILRRALARGKTSIFVLRGDTRGSESGSTKGDFLYAANLVKFIRAEFGSEFSICVAGYPQMHPDSPSKEADLSYLKEKIDSGADFVITQLIFEADVFIEFVNDCRKIGITVPIIPGVFPMLSFDSLMKMTRICEVALPDKWIRDLQPIKNDDAAVQAYGIESVGKIIDEIFASGTTNGIHVFTLNRFQLAVDLCERAGLKIPT